MCVEYFATLGTRVGLVLSLRVATIKIQRFKELSHELIWAFDDI
jgi:hypothetical protein